MHSVPPPSANKASILLALACLPILGCGAKGTPAVTTEVEPPFVSLYRNTRLDVPYAGTESCAACHPTQVEQFRSHPMGRSMVRMTEARPVEHYDAAAHNPFRKFGYEFIVQQDNRHTYHDLIHRDRDHKEIYTLRQEVEFVIGSGTRGRAYLSERDNYLFQTPINWFSQAQRWDLAPNDNDEHPDHLIRPIDPLCLFCHANHAEPDEASVNRYLAPLPEHLAIGCERCHGPGSLHVERRASNDVVGEIDDTIVNPARLEPHLRDAVCEQCHLQGRGRILRAHRKVFDFRPGLPLQQFWTIFRAKPDPAGGITAVGHVEQMQASRCYQASAGKLGCISCHDPHHLPEPKGADAFYRGRCLTCHVEKSCTLGLAQRKAKNGDSCSACHMPRIATTDIAHQANRDHRVPRRPFAQALEAPAEPNREILPGIDLVHFHEDMPPIDEQGVRRDAGLALVQTVVRVALPNPDRRFFASTALPVLGAAATAAPDDVAALEGLGYALWVLDRKGEAMLAFETALAAQPNREKALVYAATLSSALGRREAALGYWQRALKVNPWSASTHYYFAKTLWELHKRREAIDECRAAIRISPAIVSVRKLLIGFLIENGDETGAQKEFAGLMRLDPPNKEELGRVFGKLVH